MIATLPDIPETMAAASYRLPLGQSRRVAIIDADDRNRVAAYRWQYENGKVRSSAGLLWRFIMNAKRGETVIHLNDDRLDCRKGNLRIAIGLMRAQQHRRKRRCLTSRFKGVHWDTERQIWCAKIRVDGLRIFIGRYEDEMDAAAAYDASALHHFGEFARVNFPATDGGAQ